MYNICRIISATHTLKANANIHFMNFVSPRDAIGLLQMAIRNKSRVELPAEKQFNVTQGPAFGRLTVVNNGRSIEGRHYFECRCECGKTVRVRGARLKSGATQSCGCLRAQVNRQRCRVHGAVSADRTEKQRAVYSSWQGMLQRCFNPSNPPFKYYGGRGIFVCAQWSLDFRFFWKDIESGWFTGATIDRRDNNGHYNKINCRWVNQQKNVQNRRTIKLNALKAAAIRLRAFQGESAKSLAALFNVSYPTVRAVLCGKTWKI